jgi:signal transduction histidine kinase
MAADRQRRLGSVAGRLLVVTMLIVVVIIAAVSGYLLQRRLAEDRQLASGSAESRAVLARNLLDDIVRPQARSVAEQLSAFSSLEAALTGAVPRTAVTDLFNSGRIPVNAGLGITVLDARGQVVYTTLAAAPSAGLQSVTLATQAGKDSACHRSRRAIDSDAALVSRCPASVGGVEQVAPQTPALDVAAPVLTGLSFSFSGVVLVTATLADDFYRYGSVVGYPVVYIPASDVAHGAMRYPDNLDPTQPTTHAAPHSPAAVPASVTAGLQPQGAADPVDGEYNVTGTGIVESSYTPVLGPGRDTVAGWVGAEVPRPPVPWQDIRVIVGLGVTAVVVVFFVMLWFVLRFVRRPIARLERGVARIAAGDYATGVSVDSNDEIGSLARSVNRMREQIQRYVNDLDLSISQLQSVSRALTTTATGVGDLQSAILSAAAVIADGCTDTALLQVHDGALTPVAGAPADHRAAGVTAEIAARVLAGETVSTGNETGQQTLVPMFAQEQVIGAVSLVTPAALSESDLRALEALANNGGIALENTRLFEQERATVARLRELDSMKSDFLSTAQHELRTPVLAIMGQLELIRLAWTTWDDATKLEIIKDVDASTRMLSDLVETIIDFSLLSTETIKLKLVSAPVRAAVDSAVEDVRRHFKDTLPVNVHVDVPEHLAVTADAKRLRQVIRSLIDNAVKFTAQDGHIGVTVTAESGMARIEVVDDGIGISPEALPHVFDRFFQEDNSRTREHGGMGMGLALVKRLCEAHGASVTITSTPGRGTVATLLWPIADPVTAPAAPDSFHLSQL